VIPLLWAVALVLPVFAVPAGVVFTTLHSFTPDSKANSVGFRVVLAPGQ
jgi:hypothetical protein